MYFKDLERKEYSLVEALKKAKAEKAKAENALENAQIKKVEVTRKKMLAQLQEKVNPDKRIEFLKKIAKSRSPAPYAIKFPAKASNHVYLRRSPAPYDITFPAKVANAAVAKPRSPNSLAASAQIKERSDKKNKLIAYNEKISKTKLCQEHTAELTKAAAVLVSATKELEEAKQKFSVASKEEKAAQMDKLKACNEATNATNAYAKQWTTSPTPQRKSFRSRRGSAVKGRKSVKRQVHYKTQSGRGNSKSRRHSNYGSDDSDSDDDDSDSDSDDDDVYVRKHPLLQNQINYGNNNTGMQMAKKNYFNLIRPTIPKKHVNIRNTVRKAKNLMKGIVDRFTKRKSAADLAIAERRQNRKVDKNIDKAHESLRKNGKAYNRHVYNMTLGKNNANNKYNNAVNGFNRTPKYVTN